MTARAALAQFAERVGSAFVIAFAAVVFASHTNAVPWVGALDAGGFAGLVALVTTGILLASPVNFRNPFEDLAWRAVMMGLQAFAGAVAASRIQSLIHLDWSGVWHITVLAVIGSLAKNVAGFRNARTVGASPLLNR